MCVSMSVTAAEQIVPNKQEKRVLGQALLPISLLALGKSLFSSLSPFPHPRTVQGFAEIFFILEPHL